MSKAGKKYPIMPIKIWVIIYIGCLGQTILELSYIKSVMSYFTVLTKIEWLLIPTAMYTNDESYVCVECICFLD
jgi:hypothetical protein